MSTTRHARARAFVREGLPKGCHAWADKHYQYDYEEDGIMFLHCYEDNPKKTVEQRLQEACAAYVQRFGVAPNLVLVNEKDGAAHAPGCEVRAERRIGPNNYQVGRVEA